MMPEVQRLKSREVIDGDDSDNRAADESIGRGAGAARALQLRDGALQPCSRIGR